MGVKEFYLIYLAALSFLTFIAYAAVSLTRVELVSLKSFFFASFDKCVLVVFVYNCAHLRQNLLKNISFKMLRSFYEQKMRCRQGGLRRQYPSIVKKFNEVLCHFLPSKPFEFDSRQVNPNSFLHISNTSVFCTTPVRV